jgi:hypothetical protein
MTETMHCGSGKAACVIHREGHAPVVTDWRYEFNGRGDYVSVPAVDQLRLTVVHFGTWYYRRADFSPETLPLRDPNYAQRGFQSESYDFHKPPTTLGVFCLLGRALRAASSLIVPYLHANESCLAKIAYPNMLVLTPATDYGLGYVGSVRIWFNPQAFEFYHLLFLLNTEKSCTFVPPRADIGTLAKLRKWTAKFESMKRNQFAEHGWEWNPPSTNRPLCVPVMDEDNGPGKTQS